MQDADAARRLAILRGETPPPLPEPEQPADPSDKKHTRRDRDGTFGGAGRKRKRAGEDDTDFEMRVARERAEEGARVAGELAGPSGSKRQKQKEREEVNIVDSRGHIDLVGPPPKDAGAGGGDDRKETRQELYERRTRETVEKFESNYRNGVFAGQPWYEEAERRRPIVNALFLNYCRAAVAATDADRSEAQREAVRESLRNAERMLEAPTTNVWGKDDPKRREREMARLDANDPLAAMRSGAKKVRDVLKERRKEAEERWRELEQLRQEERRRDRRKKREHEHADEDENEDGPLPASHRSGRSERRHHREERHHDEDRHEGRRVHVHREERRRRREAEGNRDRENDRHDGRGRGRSRDRGSSSRSHRDQEKDDRHDRRGKDHERRDKHHERGHSEAKRTE